MTNFQPKTCRKCNNEFTPQRSGRQMDCDNCREAKPAKRTRTVAARVNGTAKVIEAPVQVSLLDRMANETDAEITRLESEIGVVEKRTKDEVARLQAEADQTLEPLRRELKQLQGARKAIASVR